MTALHAGLLCTLMFLSLCLCLFGWMSAVRYQTRRVQAQHFLMMAVSFLLLSLLDAERAASRTPPLLPWAVIAGALTACSAGMLLRQLRWIRKNVSKVSIRESCDRLPSALCFALENGRPLLRNLKMDELSHQIIGEALNNANLLWEKLAARPVVTLADGQTWSFERTAMEVDGQRVWQIVGTNVTEEISLNRQLEEGNRRLDDVNRRLREYSRDVQTVAREREALRIKVRLHDELGYTLLRTRQYLSGGQGDAGAIRSAWKQCLRLLRSEGGAEPDANSYEELLSAARTIGVAVDLQGALPEEGTRPARLVEAAMHESLTNLVRHAGGTRLEISSAKEPGGWRISLRNDGRAPSGTIVEGGGLSSLRSQVESVGGAMTVDHAPRFQLTLILPEETEAFPL